MKSAVQKYLSEIGRKGGQSTSPAKIAAARENGKRPKRRTKGEQKQRNKSLKSENKA